MNTNNSNEINDYNKMKKKDLSEILEEISKKELLRVETLYNMKGNEIKNKRCNTMDNPSPPLNNTTRGRPRKDVSASLIEVRTKLLQIPEANEYNGKTLYELARLYMYGNRKKTNGKEIWDNSHFHNQFYNNSMDMEDSNSSLHDSLDLLATKDILELPKPKKDIPLPPKWPTPIKNDDESVVDIEDKDNILKNHVKHWKKVRQTWLDHNRRKHPQHYRSIQLLETVYGMSQSSFSS